MSQWAWIRDRLHDVVSDLSVFHRIRKPFRLPAQQLVDLAWRLPHYQGAVRFGVQQEIDEQADDSADLSRDRVVDSDFAAADPILGQFVDVGTVEVID